MQKYYYLKAYQENHRQTKFLPLILLILALAIFLPFSKINFSKPLSPVASSRVLGNSVGPKERPAEAGHFILPEPTPVPTSTPTPRAETHEKKYTKTTYAIAVYGDSMVDTMGERLEYLEGSLKKLYPKVNFQLYNFGKGSENVEMGFLKWDQRFDYQDRHYPALTEIRPDIIILGSFSYNPFSPYDRNRHWLGLTKMIAKAKEVTPRVYLLAEIAPLRESFGQGPNGVNWDREASFVHSGNIVEQLENAVSLAQSLGIPLINAFQKSGGNPLYVNSGDGIHPSVLGHEFTASLIAQTIKLW